MRVYTRTGDDGETGIFGNARVQKTSARIKAIGGVDELNASLGVCLLQPLPKPTLDLLTQLQSALFDFGAELSSPAGDFPMNKAGYFTEGLEKSMDEMMDALPPLRTFILPGGSAGAAHLHMARTICRRAEILLLELHSAESVRSELRVLLNRLSDWLFVAARDANQNAGMEDVLWHRSE